MFPQIRQSLIRQTASFHAEMLKSLEMFFQCWEFFRQFDPTDVENC